MKTDSGLVVGNEIVADEDIGLVEAYSDQILRKKAVLDAQGGILAVQGAVSLSEDTVPEASGTVLLEIDCAPETGRALAVCSLKYNGIFRGSFGDDTTVNNQLAAGKERMVGKGILPPVGGEELNACSRGNGESFSGWDNYISAQKNISLPEIRPGEFTGGLKAGRRSTSANQRKARDPKQKNKPLDSQAHYRYQFRTETA